MLTFPDLLLYLGTPARTASTSVREYCVASAGGVWSPNDWQHDLPANPLPTGWRLAIVVRNPFDRAVSMWHRLCLESPPGPAFEEYLLALPTAPEPPEDPYWHFRHSISRWLGGREPDVVLRFESLAADLGRLLEIDPPELPHLHQSQRIFERWNQYYLDPAATAAACDWAREDCRRFGYRGR